MSGADVVAVFLSLGFQIHSQKGSHIKLRRMTPENQRQTLTIPNHREIDTGTLRAILRQASRYVSITELQRHFYQE